MNKLGFIAGLLTAPFLFVRHVPMGHALLGLDLFESGDALVSVLGSSVGTYGGIHVVPWWFVTTDALQIVAGIIFWFLPLLSCLVCFGGVTKPPERGKKIYATAFVLQLLVLLVLVLDGLLAGLLVFPHVYPLVEFVGSLQAGFWLCAVNLVITLLAATTYKES